MLSHAGHGDCVDWVVSMARKFAEARGSDRSDPADSGDEDRLGWPGLGCIRYESPSN